MSLRAISLRTGRTERGFTLIEVLVVLVIMASMAGLLVIGFRDNPEQRLRREADNLAGLLNAAADEAVMRGVELGLSIDDNGYRFVYFDIKQKKWQATPDRALAEHAFPDKVTVSITLDGEQLDAETLERIRALSERGEDEKSRPLVLLLSSGEVTPFTLTIDYGDEFRVVVSGDGVNPVVVAQRG